MLLVTLQMALLILCGVGWRLLAPGGLDGEQTRRVLTGVVYHLFLPLLVFSVLWPAPLSSTTIWISGVATAGVLFAGVLALIWCRLYQLPASSTGALLLAAAFPNVLYMGLPVLEAHFGALGRSVAVQYDLFACTPLLLTVGVAVAAAYGGQRMALGTLLASLFRVPALLAAIAAATLNLAGVAPVPELLALLEGFNGTVIPLMLFSLGLGLPTLRGIARRMPELLAVVVIQLGVMPLFVWSLMLISPLSGDLRSATLLEAAMPSMVLGLMLCDRFGLDVQLYAGAVTLTTALSLFTLPLWLGFVS